MNFCLIREQLDFHLKFLKNIIIMHKTASRGALKLRNENKSIWMKRKFNTVSIIHL